MKTLLIWSLITIFFRRVQSTCTCGCTCTKSELDETSNESLKSAVLNIGDNVVIGNVSVNGKDYQDEQQLYELPTRRPRRRRPRRRCKLLYSL